MKRLLLATPAVPLLLAGCGGATRHPQVASLATHGDHRSPATAACAASDGIPDPGGRPRPSLDATHASVHVQLERRTEAAQTVCQKRAL